MKRVVLRSRCAINTRTPLHIQISPAQICTRLYASVGSVHEELRSNSDQSKAVPRAPLWLGAAGLIPFVSCAVGVAAGGIDLSPLSLSVTPDQLVHLQAVYGVSILSFMGAVHWGLVMAGYQRPPKASGPLVPAEGKEQDAPQQPAHIHNGSSRQVNSEEWRYGLSVVPSLVGFGALGLFPSSPSVQLAALMAGFASVYAGDLTAASHRMVPRWYLKLRTPLTLIVLLSLGISYAHLPPAQ